MDENTFQLGLAIVAMIQTVALAYIAVLSYRNNTGISGVHDAVNRVDAKTPPPPDGGGGVATT